MNRKTAAVVLAGGKGRRIGGDTPKQYLEIGGHPLLYYSLKTFSDSFVDEIYLVCGAGEEEYCSTEIVEKYGFSKVRSIVSGGRERYHSVYNGLRAIRCTCEGGNSDPCEIVFIHDGARPFVTEEIILRAYNAAVENRAAAVAYPASDTVKMSDDAGFVAETLRRDHIWLMQTPQAFDFYEIYDAYSRLIESEPDILDRGVLITDDAMVLELFSERKVKLVMGDGRNIKVTNPDDLKIAGLYIGNGKSDS